MGRRKRGPRRLTPGLMLKAIVDSAGNVSTIAERCRVNRGAIYFVLKDDQGRPGKAWDRVREAYRDEKERIVDKAETRVLQLIDQEDDIATAARTTMWYLSKTRRKEYGDQTKVVHEGGDKPIQVQSGVVDLGSLDLPLEVRKQILAAMEKRDQGAAQKGTKEDDDEA